MQGIMDPSNSKRKRTQNTSPEQYEIYLETLENDYIMRSGTINPTLEDNYLNNKWHDLANKLNAIGKGPMLTKDVWKKRFEDWKNATRAKYRKVQEGRIATGGGIQEPIAMTPLEERGLHVWGKVAVTGTPLVKLAGGLSASGDIDIAEMSKNDPFSFIDEVSFICTEEANEQANQKIIDEESIPAVINNPSDCSPGTPSISKYVLKNANMAPRNKLKNCLKTPQSLNKNAEELKECCKETNIILRNIGDDVKQFSEVYDAVQNERNRIERRRLSFEIQKYKFENKDFHFEEDD